LADLRAVAADSKAGASTGPSSAWRSREQAVTADPVPSPNRRDNLGPVAAPLELALAPPVRRVSRFQSIRPALADVANRRPIAWAVVAMVAVFAAGLLALINPWPDDWALAPLATSMIADASQPAAYVVAVLLVGSAALAGAIGWRRDPRSWGHFVASAGALGVAIVVVAATTGQLSWSVLPWAAAVGAVGIAAVALRGATDAWLDELRGNAVVLVATATAALFVARQLIR
jgi:hypothetical protein